MNSRHWGHFAAGFAAFGAAFGERPLLGRSRRRQIEEEVAPPQAMEGERVGTIEVEVLPPPVMKPKAKSSPVGVPVAEVAPAESTPPREGPTQWLKNLTAPKATSTAASDPAPDRAIPKSTVAPRPGAALGLGRSGFGH
jgi:hypothetical protein